ncbi:MULTISPECIES: biopolymer transporter ExbD [unclassified Duganella]|uniref:ExbD/TolR family protein n=1 Tax=unclassified Duganella TaxID=2636909 RepID=UPI0006F2E7A9|nr:MULTISPECIES: biopolymer transporter ExbD [unclassified Duganella]KQV47710.1 biopolymer transporter ExbD [Duganella sp. Root336D2]KRB82002.1 biopolymer transporter ExbD [Duganella sp. Root198D2]
MAFGSFNHHRQKESMADINVTPMVDVMLVLLVIFIISAPMFTNAVQLELPKAQARALPQEADTVTLAIDAAGTVYWNNDALQAGELEQRLAGAADLPQQPELQLRADKDTRYEVVAQVMAAAQSHGLTRIGFVTDPKEKK